MLNDDKKCEVTESCQLSTTEQELIKIWGEDQIFDSDAIQVNDNFFELGGNSIIAIKIIVRIKTYFGIALSPKILFEAPTVAELATVVDRLIGPSDNLNKDEVREEFEI
ncbi:phosphopantetheine-binding protein [Clostridium cellulovorans]|uniref:Phosphopantetheine-binding n=1 Tax=Clostridium cellulovorans (strain ATCC 35296 / DSM 3052 / OCM 3 / 743B) TaxID=573061 RepID=D9SRA2_CLOC7|nr:phosphopantetheine-binding protein [Clostridium cellulovorans]ADL52331.1 phosphopantetheine-binding [Clostridium cellulovorans 743B]